MLVRYMLCPCVRQLQVEKRLNTGQEHENNVTDSEGGRVFRRAQLLVSKGCVHGF